MKEKKEIKRIKEKRRKNQPPKKKKKRIWRQILSWIACPSISSWISFVLFHCLKKRKKNEPLFVTRTSFGPVLSLLDDKTGRPKTCTHSSPLPVSVVARDEKSTIELVPGVVSYRFLSCHLEDDLQERDLRVFVLFGQLTFSQRAFRRVPTLFYFFATLSNNRKNKQNR